MKAIAVVMVSLTLAGCSAFGIRSGTEEPAYKLLSMADGLEIREYAPRIAAETLVSGEADTVRNEGFRRLAGYIFGDNRSKAKIAMTAPVAQSAGSASEKIAMTAPVAQDLDGGGQWRLRFFAPAGMTLETMPIPNDARVTITQLPAQTFAVRRFSGDRSSAVVEQQEALLRASLQGQPWTPDGDIVAWFYDPPWTLPFLRRNEVAIPVKRQN
jgi:hypothetical protein